MAVPISTLLPQVRVELSGIAEPVLEASMYRMIRRFFWESEAWKYTYDNGLDWTSATLALPSPVAGTDIPAKTIVKRVDNVKYSSDGANWDRGIPFKTRDELDRDNADWRSETGSTPHYWTHDNNGQAVVTPTAEATVDTAFLIRSVIAPVFTALTDELPDFLYYEFEESLRHGILWDLMKIPGKDWTDSKMAAYYQAQFERDIKEGRSRAEAGYGQPSGVMSYGGL